MVGKTVGFFVMSYTRMKIILPHQRTSDQGATAWMCGIKREKGRYAHTFWVNAAREETIIASFVSIAHILPSFAAHDETDQRKLVEAAKHWLEQCKEPWLLIFDNADDVALVRNYLPKLGNGSIV